MSETPRTTHILIFPFPAQGHSIPLLDLTHHIITSSSSAITVTILVTPKNLPLLNQILSVHPNSVQPLVLPFPFHPSVPPGVENARDMPSGRSSHAMVTAMAGLRAPLTEWFRSHPSPPAAIVSDMFLGWTHHLAAELGVPRVVFSPSGALALSTMYSLWRRRPRRRDTEDQNELVSFGEIPNCPEYPWWQISPTYRSYVEGERDSEFIREGFLGNLASWGLVVNTFGGIEGVYLKHLRKELGHGRVWAVGPIVPMADGESGTAKRGGSSSVSVDRLVSWLDTCGDRTVVYVCFGSQAVLGSDQMEALASGLEKSGVRFVWSCRDPTVDGHDGSDVGRVPPGFEDRVAGRGLVIRGWSPQVLILNHRAVGAFLTHCGWNSILESVVAGVPILAWPMQADQYVNATLLVDYLKVATRVCEGKETIPEPTNLATLFAKSLDDGELERDRAAELREEALMAVGECGSSSKDLESLVGRLGQLKLLAKSENQEKVGGERRQISETNC